MQTLKQRNTYTPTSTSLACCNCDLSLNKEETLSVPSLKTCFNSPEVNLPENTQELKVNYVFVLNINGNPLMPCKPTKAKKLIKGGKAKCVKNYPFTIQLNFDCENKTQEINLGIDAGYQNIGFSVITKNQELISGTVILDSKTKKRLNEKRMYRRNRRYHLRYRKPRFLNRNIKKDWLPPSIQRRYDTHLNLINKLKKLIPITNIIVEIAKFDIQKIMNPEISGIDYQNGSLSDYQNVVGYLQCRQKNICPYCNQQFKGEPKATHHIFQNGDQRRTDRIDGLILLHKKCHVQLHKNNQEKQFQKPVKTFNHSTFMSIIHKRFWNDIKDLKVTYGYITQAKRYELNLEKTHFNDAFVIAGGNSQKRCNNITIEQKHRNNRVLQLNRNGFKPSIKKQRSKILPKDYFWVGQNKYICKGMFNKGNYVLYGEHKKKEYFNFKRVTKFFNFGSLVWNI